MSKLQDLHRQVRDHGDRTLYSVDLRKEALAELYDDLEPWSNKNSDTRWIGATVEERKAHLKTGCKDLLDRAREIQSEVERKLSINAPLRQTKSAMVGFRPSVPAYLAGVPCQMVRMEEFDVRSSTTPMTIYYNPTGSCALAPETMLTRGIVIAALAAAMSVSRPVRLIAYGYWKVGKSLQLYTIDMGTRPLDWAMTSAVCHSAFSRDMSFRLGKWLADYTGFNSMPFPDDCNDVESLRKILGAKRQDFIYTSGVLGRNRDALCREPVKWIQAELDRFEESLKTY